MEAERIRLQAYIDAIPEAVIVVDRTGTIELVNRTLSRVLGATEPLVGKNQLEVLRDSDLFATGIRLRYDHEAVFHRLLSTGEPEQGLIEIDDPARTFEIHFAPLRDESGAVAAIVGTMRDITEPLELARERSRANLLAQLLDLSATLNSDLSIQSLVERVVEAAMELLGARTGTLGLIERDRMVFRRFHTPTGWVDFDVALHRGEGAPGHVWATEAPYVSNDCRSDPFVLQDVRHRMHFECLVYVPIINRSGTMIGALGVYDPIIPRQFGRRDVEALQLLANQVSIAMENARLNEMKDSFLSIVSHELKTPVTSIKGFTQVLQRRIPPESRQVAGRFLEIINNQADRLTALINDLLDLSRIQTGRFEFDLVPLDYADLVRDVAAEMQLISPRNPIVPQLADDVRVRGDGNRLRQVLVNLIDNAVKYGPADGTILVSMEQRDGEIVTSVHDQGPGLPDGEAERIFGPYYQVRREAGQATQGLGLGLYISRQIVEGHGGRYRAEAENGMAFCFTLPVTAESPGAPLYP